MSFPLSSLHAVAIRSGLMAIVGGVQGIGEIIWQVFHHWEISQQVFLDGSAEKKCWQQKDLVLIHNSSLYVLANF